MATVPADGLISSESREITYSIAPALAISAFASIGAGAIHAAAIGVHSEHRQAVITFTIVAALQIGWGALALMARNRLVAFAGIAINGAAIAGFLLAKSNGIFFIDGLDVAEKVQYADGIAALLAATSVLAVVYTLLHHDVASSLGHTAMGVAALATAIVTITGMVAAGSHSHAGGHTHAAAETGASGDGHVHGNASVGTGGTGGSGGGHSHGAAVVPPKKYDPTKPIDLGGVPGVTPEQQARAENLIAVTLARLPKFADYHVAEAAGYKSIGDSFTGDEHFINQALFNDGRILDPDYPESLVYEPQPDGSKKLAAAMFMLAPGTTLADVPDIGGKLTQWHIHNNLCFTTDGRVAGLTNGDGSCNAPLVKGPEMPMIHVWIEPNPCGPFAALEGIGGGQIAAGQTRLCDTAHGSAGS